MTKLNFLAGLGFVASGSLATVAIAVSGAYPTAGPKMLMYAAIVTWVSSALYKLYGPKAPTTAISSDAVVVPARTQVVTADTKKIAIADLHDLSNIESPLTKGEKG